MLPRHLVPVSPAISGTFLVLASMVSIATSSSAELVVLVEGSVIKVEEFRRRGDRVELHLPSGGRLELPLLRIERVVEDEVEPEVEDNHPFSGIEVDLDFRESDEVPDTPYGRLIFETARSQGINPQFVAAVVRAESAFDPHAVSRKGASGLLQLMPATAERFGLSTADIFDPRSNLAAGVRYMSWLKDRFDGNTTLVLAGYNAGEVNVDRYSGVPPFRETLNYIRRVYSALGFEVPAGAVE